MCIHHITYHLPCGHTTQPPNRLEYCNPVARALQFYHDQPREAARSRRGRCFTLECMKPPQPCGGDRIDFLRNITFVSASPSLTSSNNQADNDNNTAHITIPTTHANSTAPAPLHPYKPPTWTPAMTTLTKSLFASGEDIHSTTLLLETEFPQLTDSIHESWLHHLHSCFHAHGALTFIPSCDLNNDHLAGDVVTQDVPFGCGRVRGPDGGIGEATCGLGWDNGWGGRAWCPFFQGMEMGTGPAGVLGERGAGMSVPERAMAEMWAQWAEWRDLPLWRPSGGFVDDEEPKVQPSAEAERGYYEWPPSGGVAEEGETGDTPENGNESKEQQSTERRSSSPRNAGAAVHGTQTQHARAGSAYSDAEGFCRGSPATFSLSRNGAGEL
ncbi:MAG: hypothetical protein LQ343_003419 [Gyalolechia ehrenbergii]|nr:MAG: hypothetical protein LQ343_003419 [Gyalolechia ehrenbergii]